MSDFLNLLKSENEKKEVSPEIAKESIREKPKKVNIKKKRYSRKEPFKEKIEFFEKKVQDLEKRIRDLEQLLQEQREHQIDERERTENIPSAAQILRAIYHMRQTEFNNWRNFINYILRSNERNRSPRMNIIAGFLRALEIIYNEGDGD